MQRKLVDIDKINALYGTEKRLKLDNLYTFEDLKSYNAPDYLDNDLCD